MVKIPAGEFLMGSDEEGRPANERPQHRVAIREFAIGKYEVTRSEYARFVKDQNYKASEDGCYVYPGGNPQRSKMRRRIGVTQGSNKLIGTLWCV